MSVVMHTETWTASLELAFSRQGPERTALTHNIHSGPLLVQKALYPEGPGICHATILHPPSGIAGGDELTIAVNVHEAAHAVLSTPGATRWYKANGRKASQHVVLNVESTAMLDWLPLENLLFEEAQATSNMEIRLAAGSRAIGWDCYQLGSVRTQDAWQAGTLGINTSLFYEGKRMWIEAGHIDARHSLRRSLVGLATFPVMATVWSVGPALTPEQMAQLTDTLPWNDSLLAGASQMPLDAAQSLVLLRVLGKHAEPVRQLMIECWQHLRPLQLGVPARPLRLWRT